MKWVLGRRLTTLRLDNNSVRKGIAMCKTPRRPGGKRGKKLLLFQTTDRGPTERARFGGCCLHFRFWPFGKITSRSDSQPASREEQARKIGPPSRISQSIDFSTVSSNGARHSAVKWSFACFNSLPGFVWLLLSKTF